MARKAKQPDGEPTVPEAAKPAYDVIVGLTDAFCQTRLTWEYQMLCRKLAVALARKLPSPLTRGKPEVWAAPCYGSSAGSTSSTTAATPRT